MDAFWIIKSSFLLFGKKSAKKVTNIFDDFMDFEHSIAQKHQKVSKFSNADKNGLGEHQTMNFRHLLLS